jgi:ATP-dependent DNA helicase RecG
LVEQAREAAFEIVDADPELANHPLIVDELDMVFSDRDEAFLTKG